MELVGVGSVINSNVEEQYFIANIMTAYLKKKKDIEKWLLV